MFKIISVVSIIVFAPGVLLAVGYTGDAYSSNTIITSSGGDISVSNDGQIRSVTSASADTGGNSVGSGGSVSTGPSSATVHVSNTMGGTQGGSVHVEIETSTNGEKHKETYDKQFAPGEEVHVDIATSSGSGKSNVKVSAGAIVGAGVHGASHASTSESGTSTDGVSLEGEGHESPVSFFTFSHFFTLLPSAWHNLVRVLRFW